VPVGAPVHQSARLPMAQADAVLLGFPLNFGGGPGGNGANTTTPAIRRNDLDVR
jgi:hypothetical protein